MNHKDGHHLGARPFFYISYLIAVILQSCFFDFES